MTRSILPLGLSYLYAYDNYIFILLRLLFNFSHFRFILSSFRANSMVYEKGQKRRKQCTAIFFTGAPVKFTGGPLNITSALLYFTGTLLYIYRWAAKFTSAPVKYSGAPVPVIFTGPRVNFTGARTGKTAHLLF